MVGTVGLLAGCTSTQTTAARERINTAREVAAQDATIVRHAGTAVSASALTVVSGTGTGTGTEAPRTAIVVTLSNHTARAQSDLPISVGYTLGARRRYLNGADSLTYFASHLPLLGAHGTIRWVFSSPRRLPALAHPFALVGATPTVNPGPIPSAPPVSAAAVGAPVDGTLAVRVDNASAIPQNQLQVYVYGTRGSRIVAAGVETVSYIGGGSTETVKLRLAGAPSGATLHLEALPTIYR
jgi:hypothetical protein